MYQCYKNEVLEILLSSPGYSLYCCPTIKRRKIDVFSFQSCSQCLGGFLIISAGVGLVALTLGLTYYCGCVFASEPVSSMCFYKSAFLRGYERAFAMRVSV